MCTVICPCDVNDNGKWKDLTSDDVKKFGRKGYTEDLAIAASEPIEDAHSLLFTTKEALAA